MKEIMTREQTQVIIFWNLVKNILVTYDTFNRLVDAEEKTKILSKIAPNFFNQLLKILYEGFYLKSARILEKSSHTNTNGAIVQENLTVRLFIDREGWTSEQKKKLEEYGEDFAKYYKQIRNSRNKVLGHNDLTTHERKPIVHFFKPGQDKEFVKTLKDFYYDLYRFTFNNEWGWFTPNAESRSVNELIISLYDAFALQTIMKDDTMPQDFKESLIIKRREIRKTLLLPHKP